MGSQGGARLASGGIEARQRLLRERPVNPGWPEEDQFETEHRRSQMSGRWTRWFVIGMLVAKGPAVAADRIEKVDRVQLERQAMDETANLTMDRLLSQSPQAKRLFDRSVGYAVFDDLKVAFLVSGGGGIGLAVD